MSKRKTKTELPDAFKEKKNGRENTRNIINFAIYLEKNNVDCVFFRSSHWKRNRNRAETTENRQIMQLRWNVSKGCKSDI